jgi:hypothetical protein
MGVMTAKQLVEHISKYYTDDAELLIYWWDRSTVTDTFDDLCIDEDRVTEVWTVAAEVADNGMAYDIDRIDDRIAEAISNEITPEEKEHENCIEIMTPAGSTIHRQMEELPAEEVVLRGRLVTDSFDS